MSLLVQFIKHFEKSNSKLTTSIRTLTCITGYPDAYSEPCQASKIEPFAKIVKDEIVNYFCKKYILDVWQDSEYASAILMQLIQFFSSIFIIPTSSHFTIIEPGLSKHSTIWTLPVIPSLRTSLDFSHIADSTASSTFGENDNETTGNSGKLKNRKIPFL